MYECAVDVIECICCFDGPSGLITCVGDFDGPSPRMGTCGQTGRVSVSGRCVARLGGRRPDGQIGRGRRPLRLFSLPGRRTVYLGVGIIDRRAVRRRPPSSLRRRVARYLCGFDCAQGLRRPSFLLLSPAFRPRPSHVVRARLRRRPSRRPFVFSARRSRHGDRRTTATASAKSDAASEVGVSARCHPCCCA